MMEVHSIQEYISLLEKLEKLYTFRTSNNVSIGWIPNFTYKPHFIYRGHGDYRYTILPGIFRSKNGPEGIDLALFLCQIPIFFRNDGFVLSLINREL